MVHITDILSSALLVVMLLFTYSVYAYEDVKKKTAQNKTVFVFNPKHLTWTAYLNDRKIKSGKASGGKSYCPDVGRGCKTIVGTFKIISKKGPGCKSSRFPVETRGGAPMPWCMHFHAKGYAIHGSPDVPNYNASHGCIRVKPNDAKWLNQNFMRIGTTVIVLPYK